MKKAIVIGLSILALGSAHFRNGDRTRAEYYWTEAARIDDTEA